MSELTGRVALVTGGTRGIGLATARALTDAGATVVITGRDAANAATVAKEFGGYGLGLDVADFDAVGTAVKRVTTEHGGLDILVANAGIMENGLLGMLRGEDVRRTLDVNVSGAVAAVQAAGRAMARRRKASDGSERRGGSIVLLASVVGIYGAAGQSVYAASKAAVAALARSAARELGGRGVRVNAVAPGVIRTDLTAGLPAEVLDKQAGAAALGRLGDADEVADVIRFLAGDGARYVTGQVLGVDGGLVA
ncbi:SDR family oxidoreductase [Micromonospora musae]|uniref:SDR family oxidoreductase n=1 Tax=Micromonospora musae TaxID=1894970 RepID=A0ABX9QWI0_9ACTN|nr:SDR family oxidoreductase [Micromonospora musae]RKN14903.1 SDR family oxidoreductase [Micromonospora musae]